MARPPKAKSDIVADMSSFSEEELKQLEQEAKDEYALESKAQAAAAFKEETKRKLKQKALFSAGKNAVGEDVVSITIDLAPHAPWISINGQLYYQGVTYNFTKAQAATINDIMFRTWQHEREIGGANVNAAMGRTPMNRII